LQVSALVAEAAADWHEPSWACDAMPVLKVTTANRLNFSYQGHAYTIEHRSFSESAIDIVAAKVSDPPAASPAVHRVTGGITGVSSGPSLQARNDGDVDYRERRFDVARCALLKVVMTVVSLVQVCFVMLCAMSERLTGWVCSRGVARRPWSTCAPPSPASRWRR
jgi:hypothetical protein